MLRLLEATPTERAARLTYLLMSGRTLTAKEAAEATGVSVRHAYRILDKIGLVLPIYRDEDGRYMLPAEHRVIPPF